MFSGTISFSEAARRLEAKGLKASYRTVSDIVTSRRIKLYPHESNGQAKGLDEEGFRQVEEALTPACTSAAS